MRLFSGAFPSWQVNNIAFSAKNLLRADKGIIYAGFSIDKPFFFFFHFVSLELVELLKAWYINSL